MAKSAHITVPEIKARKIGREGNPAPGQRIAVITAYDYTFASLFDAAGIDIILVGDSLGMVVQGQSSTLPVTLDEMIYHTRCVSRAVSKALIVADLPFLSYQTSMEEAVRSAGRLLKEGGAHAVKLEGGLPIADTIARLVELDIPVMGHVGMTPQSVHRMGGFKVQGREHDSNGERAGTHERVVNDARALDEAGVFSMVVETVPADLAKEITAAVTAPTIGIGAGPHCDGQVLVSYDLLGLVRDFKPTFVKRYAELGNAAVDAVTQYIHDVREGSFPDAAHSFGTKK